MQAAVAAGRQVDEPVHHRRGAVYRGRISRTTSGFAGRSIECQEPPVIGPDEDLPSQTAGAVYTYVPTRRSQSRFPVEAPNA